MKPRIYLHRGLWRCWGAGHTAAGATPQSAYYAWETAGRFYRANERRLEEQRRKPVARPNRTLRERIHAAGGVFNA
jgi:hypothetical protein